MELEKLFLQAKDVEFIHEQSAKLLKETGCVFEDDRAVEIFKNTAPLWMAIPFILPMSSLPKACLPSARNLIFCARTALAITWAGKPHHGHSRQPAVRDGKR